MFIGIEHLTQKEVEEFQDLCARRAAAADASGKAVLNANRKVQKARAKIVYERLIDFCDDKGSKDALQFLMTRECAAQCR
jgi:Mn-containing catalase